ncbi:MAG: SpaA isopeptide-forming pilin-related protein [Coriobacteriia bacterium]|nr:SpaA isopeptide-forming pilin-related protein [Coriobacteriia bacterium]
MKALSKKPLKSVLTILISLLLVLPMLFGAAPLSEISTTRSEADSTEAGRVGERSDDKATSAFVPDKTENAKDDQSASKTKRGNEPAKENADSLNEPHEDEPTVPLADEPIVPLAADGPTINKDDAGDYYSDSSFDLLVWTADKNLDTSITPPNPPLKNTMYGYGEITKLETWKPGTKSPDNQTVMSGTNNKFTAYITITDPTTANEYAVSRTVTELWCQTPGRNNPALHQTGDLTLTYRGFDHRTDVYVYAVKIDFGPRFQGAAEGEMRFKIKTKAQVRKGSTDASKTPATSGGMYSFAGATFGVFKFKPSLTSTQRTAHATNVRNLLSNEATRQSAVNSYISNSQYSSYATFEGMLVVKGSDGFSEWSKQLLYGNYFMIELEAPAGYNLSGEVKTFVLNHANQNRTITFNDAPQTGQVWLQKLSANSGITENNPCYSLEGATFDVFYEISGAKVGTLTTDKNGNSNTLKGLALGAYYVKETQAPPGYALNPDPVRFSLTPARPGTVISFDFRVHDAPLGDPAPVKIQKLDPRTGEAYGIDDPTGASLAGAQFTWEYYAGYYDTPEAARASGAPTRTWVLETKDNGIAWLSNDYLLASSDPLYLISAGYPIIPLGTVIIQETKAPAAYLLPDPNPISLLKITPGANNRVNRELYTDGIKQDSIERLNALIVPETPRTIELKKVDADSNEPLEGALFALYEEEVEGSGVFKDEPRTQKRTDETGTVLFSPLEPGTYLIVELEPVDGWILPKDASEIVTLTADDATKSITRKNKRRDLEINKLEKGTEKPVANTEFTLHKKLKKGNEPKNPDAAHITDEHGSWEFIATLTTDNNGKVAYPQLTSGSYRLEETLPNPQYASAQESGQSPVQYFEIVPTSTDEIQVFYDELIQLSCEVYKDTINITSAAFRTMDEDYLQINNIGTEEYAYKVGFRSTSNVRADEFTVVDPMENAQAGQVRLTQLWTPVATGDTDGCFNLWYRTNQTDPTTNYSNANAMSNNPYNPNNPENVQLYSSAGWQLWAENLSTTETTHLYVADLGLADDEYITGVRYEYGSVEVGFSTAKGLITRQQLNKSSLDWSESTLAQNFNLTQPASGASAANPYPAYYLVVCPQEILPPQQITASAQANIARNAVLTDKVNDHVATTTITSFFTEFSFSIPSGNEGVIAMGYPQTGDAKGVWFLFGAVGFLLGLCVVFGVILRKSLLRVRAASSSSGVSGVARPLHAARTTRPAGAIKAARATRTAGATARMRRAPQKTQKHNKKHQN